MGELPPPRDGTQRYLAAIHDRLGDLLDRLPTATPQAGRAEGEVELREPTVRAPVDGEGEASPTGGDAGGPGVKERHPAPAPPVKSRAPKAASPQRRRTTATKPKTTSKTTSSRKTTKPEGT